MKQKLSTQFSVGFALIVLITVALISLAANFLISHQFEKYVEEQQKSFSDGLAEALSDQYNASDNQWNLDYIHGFGMYALNDGYIIKLYDSEHNIVWDAENHDMTLCHQIMNTIIQRMETQKPEIDGTFVTHCYDLNQNGVFVGHADISYYSPYYFNENAFQFIESLNRILFIVGLVSLTGAIIAGLILARRISKPIASITELTREISDGNYDIQFESKVSTIELDELTSSVNQMAEALKNQENLRKRLTTDMAHELRTPLANVSSHLEAIIEGVWEPTPERLQNCYDEITRLSGIISDLEKLRQVEDENLKLNMEPIDLFELAQDVRTSFEKELQHKHLNCMIEGSSCIIPGDRQRLYQIVFNLLSNAVKYSYDGGNILIRITDTSTSAILIVEDNGIGIPSDELQLVFERFYRTDRSRSRKTGGSGIGLTIVKSLVQAHGGTVRAESRGPETNSRNTNGPWKRGEGSRFIVTLPKS